MRVHINASQRIKMEEIVDIDLIAFEIHTILKGIAS